MQVILLEKIRNLGDLGASVNVKPGYGRNFLIPQGKAVMSSAQNIELFEQRRAELEAKAQDKLTQAEARAASLNGVNVQIAVLASEEGKLYGSVGVNEITSALKEQGVDVARHEVTLSDGPFHALGEYTVAIHFHTDVTVDFPIEICSTK